MNPRVHGLHLRMSRAYLLETETGLVLIDAGIPGDERWILGAMRRLGRDDLRLIFITHAHFDHYGSAAALRRATKAPVAVHREDAEAMADGLTPIGRARGLGPLSQAALAVSQAIVRAPATPADLLLADGDCLPGLSALTRVVHTPGHTPGSCCLLVDRQMAFVGDLITSTFRPRVQCRFATDWSQIPTSLARLQSLRPALVYPGHGPGPIPGDVLQALTVGDRRGGTPPPPPTHDKRRGRR